MINILPWDSHIEDANPFATRRKEKLATPVVPESFDLRNITLHSQGVRCPSKAKQSCKFFPNLDISQYRDSLSEVEDIDLDQRSKKLAEKAIINQRFGPSEFCWEVLTWEYVFSLIHNDQRLRMDKRSYEFIEITGTNTAMLKKRTVDATMGLTTYHNDYLRHPFKCSHPECTEQQRLVHTLCIEDLQTMMHNSECGLVVDGLWGETKIVFPFAVYEAKKFRSLKAARKQAYHACQAYLTMLDNLARNPENFAEYQTGESSKCQMFAFVSCGSFWQVIVAWSQARRSRFEIIWQGDVKKYSCALHLLCIVDQIQTYAREHHRHFVMKHLEAWHALNVESIHLGCLQRSLRYASESRGENATYTPAELFKDYLDTHPTEHPKWYQIKAQAIALISKKRADTRRRNRHLRRASAVQNGQKTAEKKRGRGRPPKAGITKMRT